MKTLFCLGLTCALAGLLRAEIAVGDPYQKVIEEKGQPTGKMEAGATLVLRYADATIRLKEGYVVAIDDGFHPGGATRDGSPAAAPAAYVGGVWITDYRAALATAKEQNRHVFLLFTGSDWCPWCKKLQAEILATAEFKRYAQQKLILVEVDFPRDKSQPSALKRQNAALQTKFQIGGYPSVVVLDAEGREVGRLGYMDGGPKPFLEQLKSL